MEKTNIYKRFLTILLLMFSTIAFTGCKKENFDDVVLPEDEILFIDQYEGWNGGEVRDGTFIDSKGDVYSYDLSQDYLNEFANELNMETLEMIRKYTEPFTTVDLSIVKKIYVYGMNVDPAAGFDTEAVGCDMGQNIAIFHNPDTDELITCYQEGDFKDIPKDKNAKKIADIYEKEINRKIYTKEPTILYTEKQTHLASIPCDCIDRSSKYVISSVEELNKLEQQSGCKVTKILDGMGADEGESYIYFVEFINVSEKDSDLKPLAVMHNNGAFDIILSDESIVEDGKNVKGVEGYCIIAAFPKSINSHIKDPEYIDSNGRTWEYLY